MTAARHPYPGLRSFRRDESDLFFGREGSVNEMVDRLGAERFLAVLGPSGCGKSSLVKTGLFDALDLGFLHAAGSEWLIVDMHPAGQPMLQLATALLKSVSTGEPTQAEIDAMTRRLRQGPRSLAKWAGEGNAPPGTNILLLVDQFEELFSYKKFSRREEAEAMVALLLESAATDLYPIYVVMTMRSEYLGACSSIDQLAEYISRGLYLTPRLERDSCREAIEGPSGVIGFKLEPALVNRMLNDLATFTVRHVEDTEDLATQLALQADQLPLMQHVLNRLWLRAESIPHRGQAILTLADYNALGGMEGAIDAHGQEIEDGLSDAARVAQEPIFRALVTGNSLATAVRLEASIAELVNVAGGESARAAVLEVVEAFRAPDCNFLRISTADRKNGTAADLRDDTVVDITHESLIRQWSALREWLKDEIKDDVQWRRLLARRNEGDLLTGASLENFQTWWDTSHPTPAWAVRHGGKFDEVQRFLHQSTAEERKRIRARQRLRWGIPAAITIALLMAAGSVRVEYLKTRDLREKADQANRESSKAKSDSLDARAAAATSEAAAEQSSIRAKTLFEQSVTDEERSVSDDEKLDMNLGSRNVQEPRRELYWLEQLTGTMEKSKGGVTEDSQLKNMFATALTRTRGQLTYFGGAHGHSAAIDATWFAHNGKWVLTRGQDRKVIVWDAANGQMLSTIGPAPAEVLSAKSNKDGSLLLTSTQNGLATVYEIPSGRKLATFSPTPNESQAMFDASFSPDSKLVATATSDGIVRVWKIPSEPTRQDITAPLAELHSPDEKTAIIFRVSFVPGSGEPLLLAGEDTPDDDSKKRTSLVRLWNYQTGKELKVRSLEGGYIDAFENNAAGDFILAAPGGALIWNPRTNSRLPLEAADPIRHAAISHNGLWAVTASGKEATLWNTSSNATRMLRGHIADIKDVSFSQDDRFVVTAADDGDDGVAKVWDVATGQMEATLPSHGHVNGIQFNPQSSDQLLTAGDDRTALLWSLHGVLRPEQVIPETHPLNDLILSSNDNLVLLATEGGAVLYDRAAHSQTTLQGSRAVRLADLSADGKYAVTMDRNASTATVWSLKTGTAGLDQVRHAYEPLKPSEKEIYKVRFSPDSRWLVTVSEDHKAVVWRVEDGKRMFDANLHGQHIYDANFDPSGEHLLLCGDDNTAAVFSVGSHQMTFPALTHSNRVTRAIYSRDGKHILTASLDGTAKLWDAGSGKWLHTFPSGSAIREVRFSPDGRQFATGGENSTIMLWQTNSSSDKPWRTLQGQTGTIYSTEFSVDGSLLATTNGDGSVFVWDVNSGSEIVAFDENPAANQTVFAHKDASLLAVASSDGRATFWRISPDRRSLSELAAAGRQPQFTPDDDTKKLWQLEMIGSTGNAGSRENKANPQKENQTK